MSKTAAGLLILASLFAGPTFAQSTAAPVVAPPPTASKELEGVTVMGKRPEPKKCDDRDKDCVALVVAELKKHYPRELKIWCNQERDRAARENILASDVFGAIHPALGGSFQPPPVTKIACASDKKP